MVSMIGRILAAAVLAAFCVPARSQTPFRFESQTSLADMQSALRHDVSVGSPRDQVRAIFVNQGGATLKIHPTQAGVEKYIYDINLCSYYIWRWNISADYDSGGKLKQIYVNGEPALPDGSAPRTLPKDPPGQNGAIVKITRPRPEAYKGESSLAAVIWDHDANLKTIDDQELMGGGPTRADPTNMGTLHAYHVEPWRSIFDMDDAKTIVPYAGDCAAADAAMAKARAAAPGPK
jgi:hypothetical protein